MSVRIRKRTKDKETSPIVWVMGEEGEDEGQFGDDIRIAVGQNGVLYVLDGRNRRIQSFSAHGRFIRTWGKYGTMDGEFEHPNSIAVSTNMDRHVLKEMHQINELASFPPGILPICLAYLEGERIYVADMGNHRIQAFTTTGEFVCKWNIGNVNEYDQYSDLICAVSPANIVYVCNGYFKASIQTFDPNGTFIRTLAEVKGNIRAMSFSDDGLVYTMDHHSDVLCYHPCEDKMGQGQSWCPQMEPKKISCMVVDGEWVYLHNEGERCIRRYRRSNGTIVGPKWSESKIKNSRRMAKDPNGGFLYMTYGRYRIMKISLSAIGW